MDRNKGRLEITGREGSKVLTIEEHPRGDGSLQVTELAQPMNARELRAAAARLEDQEKDLARQRVENPEEKEDE